jgi:hypothetical protein
MERLFNRIYFSVRGLIVSNLSAHYGRIKGYVNTELQHGIFQARPTSPSSQGNQCVPIFTNQRSSQYLSKM